VCRQHITLSSSATRAHLSLATGHRNVHEAAGICDSLLRATLWCLLLLLLLNLWGLRLDLSGTSEGSVDLSHIGGLSSDDGFDVLSVRSVCGKTWLVCIPRRCVDRCEFRKRMSRLCV